VRAIAFETNKATDVFEYACLSDQYVFMTGIRIVDISPHTIISIASRKKADIFIVLSGTGTQVIDDCLYCIIVELSVIVSTRRLTRPRKKRRS
jgi:hypothetical protein